MRQETVIRCFLACAVLPLIFGVVGCQSNGRPAAEPLGSVSDSIWQDLERNAEMSDFVVYQHEFQKDREFLNTDGEDHVKQIAGRLMLGQDARVIVERSRTTVRPNTVILHSRADDVVPFADSEQLLAKSSLPNSALVAVGCDHRLADAESLRAMLSAVEKGRRPN